MDLADDAVCFVKLQFEPKLIQALVALNVIECPAAVHIELTEHL